MYVIQKQLGCEITQNYKQNDRYTFIIEYYIVSSTWYVLGFATAGVVAICVSVLEWH